MKKVSGLPTWMAVNCNGKRGLGAMTNADKANSAADPAEPPRKIVCSLPTERPGPHNSPAPFTSNLSNDEAATAIEQIQVHQQKKISLTYIIL